MNSFYLCWYKSGISLQKSAEMYTDVIMFRTHRLKYVWSGSKGPFIFKKNLSYKSTGRALPRNRWHVTDRDLTFYPQAEKYAVGLHYWPVIVKSRSFYFWIKRKPVTRYVKAKSWNLHLISLSFHCSEKWRKTMVWDFDYANYWI